MTTTIDAPLISAVIPTVGRAEYLTRCLASLAGQTMGVQEVIIVHAGADFETEEVVRDPRWATAGMQVVYHRYGERNAAAQRNFGVAQARGDWLLFLDDDVEFEPEWVEEMMRPMLGDAGVAATTGHITNQFLFEPPPSFRLYIRLFYRVRPDKMAGRLIGPAIQTGFASIPLEVTPVEWLSGGCAAIRRESFDRVGGFAPYFAGSSPGEDMDLGYRLSRGWKVMFVPSARIHHFQAGGGREKLAHEQYQSMRSRYAILRRAMGRGKFSALLEVFGWVVFQGISEVLSLRKSIRPRFLPAWWGRLQGMWSCVWWTPPENTCGLAQERIGRREKAH